MNQDYILDVQKIKKSFQQGDHLIEVLKGLELQLKHSESVAIVGRSGSGKSTLLSLLAGLDRADEGDVVFQNRGYSSMSEEDLTLFRGRHMGIIFQQFHLLPHLTALENVSLALEILGESKDVVDRAYNSLEQVGLKERANHFPGQLSGGEKQRVAIARSMVINPDLLLADEPSGSLDEDTGEEVMELVFELVEKKKKALVLVTHSIPLASRCNRVFRLEHGVLRPEVLE